jgi:hypothetical protein
MSILRNRRAGSYFAAAFAIAALASGLNAQQQASIALQGKTIEVRYSAASMNGRKVFGGIVPYGQVWRIGEKTAPVLHAEGDLAFYGLTVPKGDYTLYVVPAADKWQLIISHQKGAGAYDAKMDLGRAPMTVAKAAAPIEVSKIALTKTAAMSGKLEISWENVVASVPFKLDLVNPDREW